MRQTGDVPRDWRDDRIAELETMVSKLVSQVEKLTARVQELEEQLGSSSRNSSKPPSSDPPTVTRDKKPPTGRKPGGQPGHKRHQRELFPPEKVRSVTDCKPERCGHCQHRLRGSDPDPLRHQVADLPKVEPLVDEYRLHALTCNHCGGRTRAQLPKDVPKGSFGPTVIAVITLLLGAYGLSRRDVAELMRDLFGLPISVGAVVGCQKIGAEALAPAHAQAQARIRRAPVKYADETGWKVGDVYACLWVVVTPTLTLFRIQAERSRAAAKKVLGKVRGLLGTDRYAVYDYWPKRMRQFCWAHISRLFVRFTERRDPKTVAIGKALIAEKDQMFEWWHRVRDGTLTRSTFQRHMRPLKKRVADLLDDAVRRASCPKTHRTCERLLKKFDALWTFVHHEGIEPTNNMSERAIRRPVIIRKTSFGSQSEHGCRFLERVLTVHATLRQRGGSVHDFIVDSCRAYMTGTPAPSLLTV
jgi:transposase